MTRITLTVEPGQTIATRTRTEHRKSPDYRILQNLVSGYIETVPHLTSVEIDGRRTLADRREVLATLDYIEVVAKLRGWQP